MSREQGKEDRKKYRERVSKEKRRPQRARETGTETKSLRQLERA